MIAERERCPRILQFEYRKRTYRIYFQWESIPPTEKCSNPHCDRNGDFAGAIVIEKILHASKYTKMVLLDDEKAPERSTVVAILQTRLGHGQTHCKTQRPAVCERAMNFQNYVATFIDFGISINPQWNWQIIAEKALQEQLCEDRHVSIPLGFALAQPQTA
jgi:hypothetical protein